MKIDNMIRLTKLANNIRFRIDKIDLEEESKKRLMTMGIYYEDEFLKSGGNGFGPILIQNLTTGSTKIAVGRELAEQIYVKAVD